jgi:predicted MFS family arabinose efflux permease
VIDKAGGSRGQGAPQAVDVAAGFNIAAFNLGVAGGSWTGSLVVAHLGLAHTPWIAAVVTLGAFGLTVLSGRLDNKRVSGLCPAEA